MTYKETLFFVGKCLTINHEKHNFEIVEEQLKSGKIDWDSVVKLSTAHYVFPALYCNLKKAEFLKYLPDDLVAYMIRIADLNRERNKQIIRQAKEINELLLTNNIKPIFLKGAGNLLEGLYHDIAERMIGDIDFIVSKEEFQQTVVVLNSFGYKKVNKTKNDYPQFKHYPRLNKEDRIAAIEIHKELLAEKHSKSFNYNYVSKETISIDQIKVLNYEHQLINTIITKQLNDHGLYLKNIILKVAYDSFLLSKQTNVKTKDILNNIIDFQRPINFFLALNSEVFNHPKSLYFLKNKDTISYTKDFLKLIENKSLREKNIRKVKKKATLIRRIDMSKKIFTSKTHRTWFLKSITDKEWLNEKMIEFGLKKPKPNS